MSHTGSKVHRLAASFSLLAAAAIADIFSMYPQAAYLSSYPNCQFCCRLFFFSALHCYSNLLTGDCCGLEINKKAGAANMPRRPLLLLCVPLPDLKPTDTRQPIPIHPSGPGTGFRPEAAAPIHRRSCLSPTMLRPPIRETPSGWMQAGLPFLGEKCPAALRSPRSRGQRSA